MILHIGSVAALHTASPPPPPVCICILHDPSILTKGGSPARDEDSCCSCGRCSRLGVDGSKPESAHTPHPVSPGNLKRAAAAVATDGCHWFKQAKQVQQGTWFFEVLYPSNCHTFCCLCVVLLHLDQCARKISGTAVRALPAADRFIGHPLFPPTRLQNPPCSRRASTTSRRPGQTTCSRDLSGQDLCLIASCRHQRNGLIFWVTR